MITSGTYILKGRAPVPAADRDRSDWFEAASADEAKGRRVARTDVREGVWVSTVFLGIDHNFSRVGPPILFETMVNRNGKWGSEQERYATWEEAEEGHARIVEAVLGEEADQ